MPLLANVAVRLMTDLSLFSLFGYQYNTFSCIWAYAA